MSKTTRPERKYNSWEEDAFTNWRKMVFSGHRSGTLKKIKRAYWRAVRRNWCPDDPED